MCYAKRLYTVRKLLPENKYLAFNDHFEKLLKNHAKYNVLKGFVKHFDFFVSSGISVLCISYFQ